MRTGTVLRALAAVALTGVAWWAAPGAARRLRVFRRVAPDLRSPALLATYVIDSMLPRLPGGENVPPVVDPEEHGARTVSLPRGEDEPALVLYVYGPSPSGRTDAAHTAEAPGGPAVCWYHGGGYVTGSAQSDARWCARLATDLGAVVVSPEYRTAPRHPFPAAHDDCFRALTWLHEHAGELGIDPQRVAVGGDSAGGGLAAAVAQRARDEGVPVCFQSLVYPMLDDATGLRPDGETPEAFVWSASSNRYGWGSYLGREPGLPHAPDYAVPARRADLAGLPPAWIGVGGIDLFHDEDVAYADRLREAGVDATVHIEPGMYHGADLLLPHRPRMRAFRDRVIHALRAGLTPQQRPPAPGSHENVATMDRRPTRGRQ